MVPTMHSCRDSINQFCFMCLVYICLIFSPKSSWWHISFSLLSSQQPCNVRVAWSRWRLGWAYQGRKKHEWHGGVTSVVHRRWHQAPKSWQRYLGKNNRVKMASTTEFCPNTSTPPRRCQLISGGGRESWWWETPTSTGWAGNTTWGELG